MPLQQLPPPNQPFEKIAMDITQLLETEDGHKYILTIIDHFSRYLVMVPLKNQTAETVAKKLNRKYISIFGVPNIVLTDQGTNFLSNLMSDICKLYDITKLRTVAYWPQGNGRCERVHRTIKKMLSHYVNDTHTNWRKILPYIVAAYNNRPHSGVNKSPHEIVFGRKMKTPFNFTGNLSQVTKLQVIKFANRLSKIWGEVTKASYEAFLRQAEQYDKDIKMYNFKINESVLLKNQRVLPKHSKKLTVKWDGPY